jgi:hypothetical protein
VKVAFDEHVPIAMVKVMLDLAKEKAFFRRSKGIVLEKSRDYAPKKFDMDYKQGSDVSWIDRFASAGGRAIISGDVKMRRERKHEMLALYQHGFVVISFEPQWGQWNFFHKTAIMIHWWEHIVDKIKNAEKSTFWVVPTQYPLSGGELRNVSIGLAQLLKDNPKAGNKRCARRKQAGKIAPEDAQRSMFDLEKADA